MEPTLEELTERFKSLGGPAAMCAIKAPGDPVSPYTRLWMDDQNASKHTDADSVGPVQYKACKVTFEGKAEPDDDGVDQFKIRGWASTNDLDLDDEIIQPKAFKTSVQKWLDRGGKMLFMHDWWALPVGVWKEAAIKKTGLWVEGPIANTTIGSDIQTLVTLGALNTLSIGFRVLKDEFDRETGIRTITDLELLEVSIVNIPANPNAVFEMAKQRNLKSLLPDRHQAAPAERKGITMDPELQKLITKMAEGWDPALSIKGGIDQIRTKLDEFNTIITAVKSKADEMKDPKTLVTHADFLTFCDKTKSEVAGLMETLKELKLAQDVKGQPIEIVSDWRSMLSKGVYLRDENGKALSTLHQKAYRILNTPVDYDKSQHGAMIKAARNLNDFCILQDAYCRKMQPPGYRGMESLEAFQKLAEIMLILDKELGTAMKAMYTGGAGVGSEWMPTLWSAEFETLYRLRPGLVSYLRPAWQMPSATAKWPILAGGATAYIVTEPATNNPTVMTKSNLTSAVVTFSARTIGACLPVSKNLLEDVMFDIMGTIREEMVIALVTAEEDADINGDNSATHFDTGRSLTSASDDPKCLWKGFRKLAVDLSNTWDTQSTTLGGAATTFTAPDVRYNRQLLGVLSTDPSELLHITSIEGYFKMLAFTEVTKANEFGYASTWLSGKLPALDGVEIYVSSQMPANLNASGIYDASVVNNTGILTIHKRSFMPGEKRGATLEFDYKAEIQQYLFISTMRRDFQNMRPSTQKPVSFGYNVDN